MVARKKLFRLVFTIIIVLLLLFLIYLLGMKFLVCQHQRSLIIELKEWQDEYSKIDTLDNAIDAIAMWEYMNRYYWPGKGYSCSQKMTLKVEDQYRMTIGAIVVALEKYSGLKYGEEYKKWKDWADGQKTEEPEGDN